MKYTEEQVKETLNKIYPPIVKRTRKEKLERRIDMDMDMIKACNGVVKYTGIEYDPIRGLENSVRKLKNFDKWWYRIVYDEDNDNRLFIFAPVVFVLFLIFGT